MHKLFFLFPCLFFFFFLKAQSFYNGSFEINTAGTCITGITDVQFSSRMPHVVAFGKTDAGPYKFGKTSIQDSGCSVVPQHGDWCIGLHSGFGTTSDAIALELDSVLTPGTLYYISFYLYGNMGFQNFQCNLELGESRTDSVVGKFLYSFTPTYLSWKNCRFSFIASDSSKYITVKIVPGYNSWNQVDNFAISRSPIPLGLEHYTSLNDFSVYPNPASENFNIRFENTPQTGSLEIYNAPGILVLQTNFNSVSHVSLAANHLPEGVYSVKVRTGKNFVCKKVVLVK